MNNEVLVTVGGITCELYAKKMLLNHPDFDAAYYKKIIETDTEFRYNSWTDITPFTDKIGDVFKSYLRPARLKSLREDIEMSHRMIVALGGQPIYLAHSLGTIALAGANIESSLVMMCGSPIEFDFAPLRTIVQSELRSFPWGPIKKRLQCQKLVYLYSKQDRVCKSNLDDDFVKAFGCNEFISGETNSGHSYVGYITKLIEMGFLAKKGVKS